MVDMGKLAERWALNLSKTKDIKSHGFKNVYHKEEYGEHKTFHDEHRETDHKKKYHDEHKDYSHHGGKQFKHHANKGHYDENKHGSDFHKFGKAGHDSHHEGALRKADIIKLLVILSNTLVVSTTVRLMLRTSFRGEKAYHNGHRDVDISTGPTKKLPMVKDKHGGHKLAGAYDGAELIMIITMAEDTIPVTKILAMGIVFIFEEVK
ncbi:hypothetical protein CEXT_647341 [Caerostris extrusa]|uniref:Uncharacterized protein n=1 Tax=Caerostris extrusa TaxID=172846 RepID=A0AAV4Y947_CAEEX|nr:hypothetical protein CEXT_647341 [Caerostris extrusa]